MEEAGQRARGAADSAPCMPQHHQREVGSWGRAWAEAERRRVGCARSWSCPRKLVLKRLIALPGGTASEDHGVHGEDHGRGPAEEPHRKPGGR